MIQLFLIPSDADAFGLCQHEIVCGQSLRVIRSCAPFSQKVSDATPSYRVIRQRIAAINQDPLGTKRGPKKDDMHIKNRE